MTTFDEALVQTTLSPEIATPPAAKTEAADTTLNADTTLQADIEALEKIVDGVLSESGPAER
jgi:hypothetical protein